jgi:hypothetical protein
MYLMDRWLQNVSQIPFDRLAIRNVETLPIGKVVSERVLVLAKESNLKITMLTCHALNGQVNRPTTGNAPRSVKSDHEMRGSSRLLERFVQHGVAIVVTVRRIAPLISGAT